MTLEILNYYQKMGDVASQILDIKEKSKAGKTVSVLGLPDYFTPDDLLDFQLERMRILDTAVKCTEEQIVDWISAIGLRKTDTDRDLDMNSAELQLLEIGLIK